MGPTRPGDRRRRARPSAERLEPRRLLATFVVNSFDDILSPPAGVVTLRSAIQAANNATGADTIVLPFAGTYRLTSLGAGATDNSAGELAVADAGDLTIQNASGGNVTIDGGGLNRVLDVDPAASNVPFTVTLSGLTITGGLQRSGDGGGVEDHGGASLVLVGSKVAGNSCYSPGGLGAGIAMEPGSSGGLTLVNTEVSGNYAGEGGGGVAGLGTGTILIGAGSLIASNTTGGASGGGGVYLKGSPLNVAGAVIRGNRALGPAPNGTPGPGGGISNAGAGAVAIYASILEGNASGSDGGGYDDNGLASLAVANSFFLDNVASGDGGGIAARGPLIAIANSTLSGNTALKFSQSTDHPGGGGLYVAGTGTTRVVDSAILGNSVAYYGGGIDDLAANLVVTGSTIAGNRCAYESGGGISAESSTGDLTINDTLFRGNSAAFSSGAFEAYTATLEISNSRFAGNSSSLAVAYIQSKATLTGCTFDDNRSGARIFVISLVPGDAMANCTIAGNTSADATVQVTGSPTGTLAMVDDTIAGNTTTTFIAGGGIYQDAGTLTVRGTILAGNTTVGTALDYNYVGGTLTDGGNNLLGTTYGSGGKFNNAPIIGNPKLGPLVDNGGQEAGAPADRQTIPTLALLPGSPAFAKGAAGTGTPTTDARGFARPAKPAIGAYQPQYASTATPNQVYVEDLYEVLFGRVADAAGLAAWTGYLDAGGSPTAAAQALGGSAEGLTVQVIDVTRRYLGRTPSSSDVAALVAYLQAGHTPEQLAASFLGSPEFAARYGGNPEAFIQACYTLTLGRAASPDEVGAWEGVLNSGVSHLAAGTGFLTSSSYLTNLIQADYPAYLGRPATPAELANFVKATSLGATSLFLRAVLLAASYPART